MPYADPVKLKAYKAKKSKEYNARKKAEREAQRKAEGKAKYGINGETAEETEYRLRFIEGESEKERRKRLARESARRKIKIPASREKINARRRERRAELKKDDVALRGTENG